MTNIQSQTSPATRQDTPPEAETDMSLVARIRLTAMSLAISLKRQFQRQLTRRFRLPTLDLSEATRDLWLRLFRNNNAPKGDPKIRLSLVSSLLSLGQFKLRHYLRFRDLINIDFSHWLSLGDFNVLSKVTIDRDRGYRVGVVVLGIVILLVGLTMGQLPVSGEAVRWSDRIFPLAANATASQLDRHWEILEAARDVGDLPGMIEALTQIYMLDPQNEGVTLELAELYYSHGRLLRNNGNFEEAQRAFNQALTIQGTQGTMESAQIEQTQITRYFTGLEAYQSGRWAEAIDAFTQIFKDTPNYPHIREILYSAHFNHGIFLESQSRWAEAQAAYQSAADVMPTVTEAGNKVAEMELKINPPTPTLRALVTHPYSPTPEVRKEKLVLVDISDQQAYTFDEQGAVVHNFVISTGKPGNDTRPGTYRIQNKIPVAYASTWNLDMPYWLGIYWSGNLQNGFHAVPTVRHTGVTMWDGYLGQRVSYGCVILSMDDAERLYSWVDVGTKVTIQY